MTVYEFTVIRCDAPRCRARFPSGAKPMPAAWTYARKQAAIAGWTQDHGVGDFCPEHGHIEPVEGPDTGSTAGGNDDR